MDFEKVIKTNKQNIKSIVRLITKEENEDIKVTPEDKVVRLDRQKVIVNAINSLKPKFKEVIMMCEINGYSYEECAKELNCPVGTVKSRIYNAKKELAEVLKDLL